MFLVLGMLNHLKKPSKFQKIILTVILGLFLTIYFTFPLIANLRTSYPKNSDFYLNAWTYWYTAKSVVDGSILNTQQFYNTDHLYPFPGTLAQQDFMLLPSVLLYLPIFTLTKDHILSTNVLIFMTYFLNFASSFYFIKKITRETLTGLFGAMVFSFSPSVINLWGGHLEYLSRFIIPPLTYFFLSYLKTPKILTGFAFFACYTALWFTSIVLALLTTVLFLVAGIIYFFYKLFSANKHKSKLKLVCFALTSIIFLPLIWRFFNFYIDYSKKENFTRHENEIRQYTVSPLDFVIPFPNNILFGFLAKSTENLRNKNTGHEFNYQEHTMSFGYLPLVFLVVSAIFFTKTRRKTNKKLVAIIALVCLILAFGPKIYINNTEVKLPYYYISQAFPPLQAIRTPTRIKYIGLYFVAILASYGLSYLGKKSGKYRRIIFVSSLLVLTLEYKTQFTINKPEYKRIDYDIYKKKVLFLPIKDDFEKLNNASYSIYNIVHNITTVNGSTGSEYQINGFFPFVYNLKTYSFNEYWFELLSSIGVDFVIVSKTENNFVDIQTSMAKVGELTLKSLKIYEDENWLILDVKKFYKQGVVCLDPSVNNLGIKFNLMSDPLSNKHLLIYSGINNRDCNLTFLNQNRYVSMQYKPSFQKTNNKTYKNYLIMPVYLQAGGEYSNEILLENPNNEQINEVEIDLNGSIFIVKNSKDY